MKDIYLDNSATTPVYPEVIELMGIVQRMNYGNPSSRHRKGIEAEKLINLAREKIFEALGVSGGTIIFTSGGTESNNLAVGGISLRNRRRGNHIITSLIEHPSVLNMYKKLEKEGFKVSFLSVNQEGEVNKDELEKLINPETILVSIVHANNETGFIQDIGALGKLIKNREPNTYFHVDAVQSFCKTKIRPIESLVDSVSLSAHKIHGPKGIGALWIRKESALHPLFEGGDQEKGLRPGTENTAAICGFGEAVSIALKNNNAIKIVYILKKLFYEKLAGSLDIDLNGPSLHEGAPHILNISFSGVRGETLASALESEGVFVSPGSACHSRRPEPSHVLKAMGLNDKRIESALRFSFSVLNDEKEIDEAASITIDCVKDLRALMS